MAQASKRKKRERRNSRASNRQTLDVLRSNFLIRGENAALRNRALNAEQQHAQTRMTLLAVLATIGGQLAVKREVFADAYNHVRDYNYTLEPVDDTWVSIVLQRVITTGEEHADTRGMDVQCYGDNAVDVPTDSAVDGSGDGTISGPTTD